MFVNKIVLNTFKENTSTYIIVCMYILCVCLLYIRRHIGTHFIAQTHTPKVAY